ncbi:hypothetical protein KQ875_00390 [Mycoplasma zalophi]|uniref:Uncharacterized protein n=1 Tax=Mycoplasma zalophi TaxID=191287 RepID=A0ABS6DP08_9MOLU|nr:hypothetical protein [Mycoplasma zalophi]MBU4692056.1 hypothetical protein [Mycoplasma zalophi]
MSSVVESVLSLVVFCSDIFSIILAFIISAFGIDSSSAASSLGTTLKISEYVSSKSFCALAFEKALFNLSKALSMSSFDDDSVICGFIAFCNSVFISLYFSSFKSLLILRIYFFS